MMLSPYNKLSPYGQEQQAVIGYSNTKYIEFGGTNEYILIGSPVTTNTTFSVNFWYKKGVNPDYDIILGDSGTCRIYMRVDVNRLVFRGNLNSEQYNAYVLTENWVMVTLTKVGTSLKYYINGELLGTDTVGESETFTVEYIERAGSLYGANNLDQIALFSVDIVTSLPDLYGGGTPQTSGNPALISGITNLWSFDDVTAWATIPDSIGSADGTAINMEEADIKTY